MAAKSRTQQIADQMNAEAPASVEEALEPAAEEIEPSPRDKNLALLKSDRRWGYNLSVIWEGETPIYPGDFLPPSDDWVEDQRMTRGQFVDLDKLRQKVQTVEKTEDLKRKKIQALSGKKGQGRKPKPKAK